MLEIILKFNLVYAAWFSMAKVNLSSQQVTVSVYTDWQLPKEIHLALNVILSTSSFHLTVSKENSRQYWGRNFAEIIILFLSGFEVKDVLCGIKINKTYLPWHNAESGV